MASNPSEVLIRELKRRRYSPQTIKTYVGCLERFLRWCKKPINQITKKEVREYLEMKADKERAGNTLNVILMALKFYFEQCLGRKMWIDIKYSKTPKRIQRFLTKQEILKMFKEIKNFQHRLMIELMYSAGLRVGEVVNLKVKDLVLEEDHGFVRNGKGGKDRVFVIASIVREKLKYLIENFSRDLADYVFLTNRGRKYNIRSLQAIVKKSAKKSGIENWQEVHCHTLRHSFATHLIEHDYTVSDVQASLGHKSPETSMVYVHGNGRLIGIKSPLDF